MEPLRERIAVQVRKAIFKAEAWAVDEVVPEITDAIMQAVEEDRAARKEHHEEIEQSRQRWRARAEKAEAREAALRTALEWYAIPGHYVSSSVYMGGGQGPTMADTDGGKRALAALAVKEGK